MQREYEVGIDSEPKTRRGGTGLSRRAFIAAGTAAAAVAVLPARGTAQTRFKRVPIQYIAALAEPHAKAGNNAQQWGLWRHDPGPRGVWLSDFDQLQAAGGIASAGWRFDGSDWWLEEHGLIMESPEFPLPPGRYMVTGGREVRTVLTVHAKGGDGAERWELADGATIYDVTHLRCRSARYTPAAENGTCSPAKAQASAFPVSPGAQMPPVESCSKQDYAVLIVIGVADET